MTYMTGTTNVYTVNNTHDPRIAINVYVDSCHIVAHI